MGDFWGKFNFGKHHSLHNVSNVFVIGFVFVRERERESTDKTDNFDVRVDKEKLLPCTWKCACKTLGF